jgi:ATP-binding cassette subfamily D (ALD) protein 3
VDAIFFSRILKLLKIVIPSWRSVEVLDLALLTVFLVLRTFLTIYISTVNGKIVKAIIQKDLGLFIKRVMLALRRYSGWAS